MAIHQLLSDKRSVGTTSCKTPQILLPMDVLIASAAIPITVWPTARTENGGLAFVGLSQFEKVARDWENVLAIYLAPLKVI